MHLRIGYCYDDALRQAANDAGRNYWYRYIEEIFDRMGATAAPISREALADPQPLATLSALVVGDLEADQVPPGASEALAAWVEAGGVLVAFMTAGLEDVFGCRAFTQIRRPGDDFCQSSSFELADHPVTAGVRYGLCPGQRLIVIGDALALDLAGASEVARLFNLWGADTGRAAITARPIGRGWAFYFGFNVAQTLWAIQQGRPIDADYDGDGYLRFSDARTIGSNDPAVAYADEILFLLTNMLARRPHPLIAPVPPLEGQPADVLLFWGGDDEHAPNTQVWASDWMKSRGLPYHINIMPLDGTFAVTREEFAQIEANGHECSLHFNFIDDFTHPSGFTREDVALQARLYREAFGKDPICTVNHWCRWVGWHEPAVWMRAEGARADNCRIHRGSPPYNPANMFGFSFGTAYPYWFYSDFRDGNQRLDFLEQPIVAYEMGYVAGSPHHYFDDLHTILDVAIRYHLTLDMFYHPCNIYAHPACRDAVDEVLRYLDERQVRAVHMGNDELWRWWSARSQGRVDEVVLGASGLSCQATCDYRAGFTLRIPCGERKPVWAACDGSPVPVVTRREFGQTWAEVALSPGAHQVSLGWE